MDLPNGNVSSNFNYSTAIVHFQTHKQMQEHLTEYS